MLVQTKLNKAFPFGTREKHHLNFGGASWKKPAISRRLPVENVFRNELTHYLVTPFVPVDVVTPVQKLFLCVRLH